MAIVHRYRDIPLIVLVGASTWVLDHTETLSSVVALMF